MPRAMGIGSHLILVFLSAEFNLDRKDSFLCSGCLSHMVREEEKVRAGLAWWTVDREADSRAEARKG